MVYIFQLTAVGLKSLTAGCTGLKNLIVNDFPTLDDNAIMVCMVTAFHAVLFCK